MKSILTLLLLCLSTVVFAQSKGKLNKQLKEQYSAVRTQYYSELSVSRSNLKKLESERHAFENTILPGVQKHYENYQGNVILIKDVVVAFTKLKIDSFDLAALNALNNKSEVLLLSSKRDFGEVLKKQITFLEVQDTLHLDGLKKEEQNIQLSKQLSLYQNAISFNKAQNDQISNFNVQLEEDKKNILSIYAEFDELDKERGQIEKRLYTVYRTVTDDYRKNGPEGFSSDYAEIFPWIHNKKVLSTPKHNPTAITGPVEAVSSQGAEPAKPISREIYDVVEQPAEFQGGMDSLSQYLIENIRYPKITLEDGMISGSVYVKFVITSTGKITNAKILKGTDNCEECDLEVLRVVNEMPNWKPALNKGKAVDSYFTLPVRFGLK